MSDRELPASAEHERELLGALLWADRYADLDDIVGQVAIPACFHTPKHRTIYAAMLELGRVLFEPISDISVGDLLEKRGELAEAGGRSYLMELKNDAEYSTSAMQSAKIVRQMFVRRRMIESVDGFTDSAFDRTHPIEESLTAMQSAINGLNDEILQDDVLSTSNLSVSFLANIDKYQSGEAEKFNVQTGLDNLDDLITGFKPGNMIVVAGDTGQGKTTLAMQIALHNASRNKPVFVVSLEMIPEELYSRLTCSLAGVDSRDIYRKGALKESDYFALMIATQKLDGLPLYFDQGIDKSNAAIRAKLRKQIAKRGVSLCVIDYIGLVNPTIRAENKTQEVTYISREIKRMAVEFRIPIIALSQLSRARHQRSDTRPRLHDLRDSGAVEQDADMVMFIHEIPGEPENSRIYVDKNRSGATGSVDVINEKRYTRLRPLDRYRENILKEVPADEFI